MSSFVTDDDEITSKTMDNYVNDIQEGKRIISSEIFS